MEASVNGTRLWFDVEGPEIVPEGPSMRTLPTVLAIHGGPGGYDHSYLRPYGRGLAGLARVVYLDLRNHGRSAREDPARWSLEQCADDIGAFCDAVGINAPVVLGHSLGGMVALLYGIRHPTHARALILQSTMARFDLDRLVRGFHDVAGDEVSTVARRRYGGEAVPAEQWARVYAAFGPVVPSLDELARVVPNPDLRDPGMELLRRFDAIEGLDRIACPTLVCVGALDPVTPVDAAREIVDGLPGGLGRLEVLDGAGHFPWLDTPVAYWRVIRGFVHALTDVA